MRTRLLDRTYMVTIGKGKPFRNVSTAGPDEVRQRFANIYAGGDVNMVRVEEVGAPPKLEPIILPVSRN